MEAITQEEMEFWKRAALSTLEGKISTESDENGYHTNLESLAQECFDHADAMLEEFRNRMEILQRAGRIMRGGDG